MQKFAAWVIAWLKIHWAEVIVWLVLLALLLLFGWLVWRRYGDAIVRWGTTLWMRLTRVPELPQDALTRVWRQFKADIPYRLRAAVSQYPVFLVIGDLGSGKSSLIQSCGHLDVQDLRYHSRSIEDTLLQAYLGNNEIILELSSSFLYTTGQDHANALLALWSKLPSDTTLVFALDARGLTGSDTDQQTRIVNALVSKLALFSEVSERPVPFRVALTRMDNVRGFPEFYAYAANSGLDIHVALEPSHKLPNFSRGLDHYLHYVTNFLTHLSARDFIEAMGFLNEVRGILGSLQSYLLVAVDRNELGTVALDSICLISDGSRDLQVGLTVNDPFKCSKIDSGFFGRLSKKHMRRVLWFGALGTVFMLTNFLTERYWIENAADLVARIPTIPAEQYAQQAHPHFQYLQVDAYRPGDDHFYRFGAHYYPHEARVVGKALASAIRTQYLLPGLSRAQNQSRVYAETVRWLALLHANGTNLLGTFFTDPSIDTGLPLSMEIRNDYVTWNTDLNDPQLIELESQDYGMHKGKDPGDRPWTRFSELLEFSAEDTYLSQDELIEIQNAARALQSSINHSRTFPEIDEQIIWLTQNGHISPKTRQNWAESPTQSQLQSHALRDVLTLVTASEIERFEKPQNITQVLELTQKLLTEYKEDIAKNTLGNVGATIDGRYYSFDSNRWLSLILRSQVREVLTDFYRQNYANNGWIFFDPQAHPYLVPLGISTDSSGGLANNAQVDVRLTRDSFEQKVKPAIILMSKLIGDLPLQNQDKQALVDFFVSNLTIYAGNYADAYWSFFKNMSIRISTPEGLQNYLKELQRPGSAFVLNLLRVKENVLLDLPTEPNFQPVRDRLSDFQFLQKLMQDQSGSYPQLQRYIALTGTLLDQLSQDPMAAAVSPVGDKSPSPDAGLKAILTPLGRVSYDILEGGPTSLIYQVDVYLRELNIPASWQSPFLVPFQRARDMGRQEVNASINNQWHQLWDAQILPFLSCFPFERQRPGVITDCDTDAIQTVFHPTNGTFWLGAKSKFGGLFSVVDGRWIPHQEITRNFVLPESMQRRLDAASALTQSFWAKDGTNQPLTFKVKPSLLPEVTVMNEEGKEVPMPSLSFLRSPGSSVLGFNQRREWQDFTSEWWQKSQVSAGIEFISPTEKVKKYASKDVDETRWALFHLLMSAERGANFQYTWKVTHPEKPERNLALSFTFKRDPFELFNALK